ncbi:MAG: hypothetical protein V4614_04685 [Pseudomonadota bacterium]
MRQGDPSVTQATSARLPALAAALCLAGFEAVAAPADDVKALLEQGKDKEAYATGKASSDALGTPLFDFYFGVAALNAGVPGEGVLALERYLLEFPDNRSAQFQLARGYFILGEDQRAREEFSNLAPDATVAELNSITQFLDAIRARESSYKPTSTAYVEIGGGYDSNINSGTRSGQVAGLPAGFVIVPGQSSEQQGDFFSTVSAGVQGSYPVAPGLALYGGAMLSGRFHKLGTSNVFDQALWGLQGGVSRIDGRNLYRFGVDLARLSVSNQDYLGLSTLVGEWQHQSDQFNRFGLTLQYSDQAYRNINTYLDKAKTVLAASGADVRDSRLTNLTASWTRTLVHPWNPVLATSLSYGDEKNIKNRQDLSRSLVGLRSSVVVQFASKWSFGAGLSYQNSRHGGDFATGVSPRRDDFLALDLSSTYPLDRNWSVRGEYQRVDQRSTIGFFKYTRSSVAVKLRYEFK